MKNLTGIILISISAACFGTLAIFGQLLYTDGVDTFTMLFLRFGLAAVIMAVIIVARKESLPRGRVLGQLIGMGAVGYVGQSFAYLTAIQYASAGLVALLLYLYPTFVVILSAIFLREKATRAKIVALILALVGTALTVGPSGGKLIGILLAISAALIYSIYIIVGAGVMKQVSTIQSALVIFASAGAVYGTLALSKGLHLPASADGWWAVAGIVLIATVIPVSTFLAGLERIGPSNAAMLSVLEPAVTVMLTAWLFSETLQPVVLFGGALILISGIVLARSEIYSHSSL